MNRASRGLGAGILMAAAMAQISYPNARLERRQESPEHQELRESRAERRNRERAARRKNRK